MATSMRFEGGREFAAMMRNLPKSVNRNIRRDALEAMAEPMITLARRLAPYEPGAPDLRDSIEFQHVRSEYTTESTLAWGPIRWFFYGHFQEWGTSRHAAQPFMRPGFDQNRERSLAIASRNLWENIQSYINARNVR